MRFQKCTWRKGVIRKNLVPENIGRGHCYILGIASPPLGDVRVGLAHKVPLGVFCKQPPVSCLTLL